jgi:hypothetical protein
VDVRGEMAGDGRKLNSEDIRDHKDRKFSTYVGSQEFMQSKI